MKTLTKKLLVALVGLTFFPLGHTLANNQGIEDKPSCFQLNGNVIVSFNSIYDHCRAKYKEKIVIPGKYIIGAYAFHGGTFNEVVLEEGVTVGPRGFESASIKQLEILGKVNIQEYGFANTKQLEEAVFPEGTRLGEGAFEKSSVKKVIFKKGVVAEKNSFANTKSLEEVIIQKGAKFQEYAFINSSVKKVILVNGATLPHRFVFVNTHNLTYERR